MHCVAEWIMVHQPKYFHIWKTHIVTAKKNNNFLLHPSFNHADVQMPLTAPIRFPQSDIPYLNKPLIEFLISK